MFNKNVRPIAIVQSDTTQYLDGADGGGMLLGVLCSADGNLVVENDKGTEITIVVPAAASGGCFPVLIPGPFTRVKAGTTIADANMIGYQQA